MLAPATTTVNSSGVPIDSLPTNASSTPIAIINITSNATSTAVPTFSSMPPVSTMSTSTVISKYTFDRNVKYKDENPDVLVLQQFLAKQGYLSVTSNGYFGNATRAALIKFQSAHGLPASGFFGPLTRAVANQ